MISTLYSLVLFLFAILILVTFHEYGHFTVARLCGVKVKRFSVGFGKVLFSWYDKKQTEFAISAIPLGGYVKMLDEREGPVAEEDLPDAFNRKSLWRRMAIIVAGPLFNVIFAVFAYWLMFVVGISSVAPVVGSVATESIAAQNGIKDGDEIIAIGGEPVNSWQEAYIELLSFVGTDKPLDMTLKRSDTGKTDMQLDISQWQFDAGDPQVSVLDSLGIEPYYPTGPITVNQVLPDTPAASADIKKGDVIDSVDGITVLSWQHLLSLLETKPSQLVTFGILRNDQRKEVLVTLDAVEGKSGSMRGFLGIQPILPDWPDDMLRIHRYGPIKAIWPALEKTWDVTVVSWQLMTKMVTGQLSFRGISGPIGIAQGASYSASLGLSYFLSFLALISISLAIINMLPIPILDGGHLLYCLVELLTGKPVSDRVQMVAAQLGIFFLMTLMLLAFYNDLSRL